MIIESLEVKDFRNYRYANIELNKDINILYGRNAQGKTNILEAIYVACTSRSQLRAKDREMVNFDSDDSHIRMNVLKKGIHMRVDIHIKRNKNKGIAINGNVVKKIKDYFGQINVISFSPEDLNIIKNSPADRRNFIDSELCQINRAYLNALTRYNKILNQRNSLLREINFKKDNIDTLDIWNEELVSYGSEVIRYRKEYIEELSERTNAIHKRLTGTGDELVVKYEPNVSDRGTFEEKLKSGRDYEIRNKTTMFGPQRDELSFLLNGMDMKKYGSQGQKRTVALALKLAEIEIVKLKINDDPVLLLDDVMSELDSVRQKLLINNISGIQTIITCTGIDEFIENNVPYENIFFVDKGTVTKKRKSV